jgi:hypothetical protein
MSSSMAMIPAKERNLPQNTSQWMDHCSMDDDQIKAVLTMVKNKPSFAMFKSFDEDDLVECGLGPIQIKAWQCLADRIL